MGEDSSARVGSFGTTLIIMLASFPHFCQIQRDTVMNDFLPGNTTFVDAEKKLLLDPDYFPDCRPLLSPPGLKKPHASKHLRIRSLP